MAWKQMDIRRQRAEFAVRLARGEKLSTLCREEITRPTGYLWKSRFAEHGLPACRIAAGGPSLAPIESWPHFRPDAVEARIVQLRVARPDPAHANWPHCWTSKATLFPP
jgi:hypothetical protein